MTRKEKIKDFQRVVWAYYRKHKRDLPWRRSHDPYAILVSEIMLQQTQVDRVIPYYEAWLKKFPSIKSLQSGDLEDVLTLWQGLGYNRRAVALRNTAKIVADRYKGKIPQREEELIALPGIGAYTARAILAFAYGKRVDLIETNIRRAYIHHFFPRRKTVADKDIQAIMAETRYLDARAWYYALMDYGAYLGRSLKKENPNKRSAHYTKQSSFKGSLRQLRGKLVRMLVSHKKLRLEDLPRLLGDTSERLEMALRALQEEGLLSVKNNTVYFRKS